MNDFARFALSALAMMLATSASAQTFKCVSKDGKVTYSSSPCASLGLKDAGEVRDQLNLSPAQRVVPFDSAPPAAAPAAPAAPAAADSKPAAAAPERRCFTIKTVSAKGVPGVATRCNDDVPENDPVPNDARTRGETKAQ